MCMHLAAGLSSAIGARKSSTSFGSVVSDIVTAVLGAGFLTFLTWVIDRIRTRSRFGVQAAIDDFKNVHVSLVKKGSKKGYPQAIKVVVVKPRLYKLARRVVDKNDVSPIEVGLLSIPDAPLRPDQPLDAYKALLGKRLLPPPLNPFRRFSERKWKRWELRVEFTASQKTRYIRCKHERGRFNFPPPDRDAGK